jgi:hypothetical protein
VNFNGLDRVISSVGNLGVITTNSLVGSLSAKTINSSDVDPRGETITIIGHGFLNGSRVRYASTGDPIRGLHQEAIILSLVQVGTFSTLDKSEWGLNRFDFR